MAHAQNTPRGLFAKAAQINVGAQEITANSTALLISGGVRVSAQANAIITGDTNGIVVAGGVKLSNAKLIRANSTGYILATVAALPATDNAAAITLISNSTGVALGVNSTGTTWKYLLTTSVQPT